MAEHRRNFIRAGAWSSLSGAFSVLSGLIIVVMATSILEKVDIGRYFFFFATYQLLIVIGDLGLKNLSVRILAEKPAQEKVLQASRFFTLTLVCSVIFCMSLVALAMLTDFFLERGLGLNEIIMMALAAISMLLFQSLHYSMVAFGNPKLINDGYFIYEIARVTISGLLLYSGTGVKGLIGAIPISIILALMYVLCKKNNGICLTKLGVKDFARLKEGVWIWLTSLVSVLSHRSIDLIVGAVLGLEVLALYAVAQQIPSALRRVFDRVRPFIMTVESKSNKSSELAFRITIFCFLLIGILIMASSELIISFLYGSQYLSAVSLLKLFSIWLVVTIVNYQLAIKIIMKLNVVFTFLMGLVQLVVVMVTLYVFLPVYGDLGGCYALIAASLTGVFVNSILLVRFGLLQREIILSLAKVFLILGALFIVRDLVGAYFYSSMFLSIAVCVGFRLVSYQELALIVSMFNGRRVSHE